jgi:signal transduction histidine kinase
MRKKPEKLVTRQSAGLAWIAIPILFLAVFLFLSILLIPFLFGIGRGSLPVMASVSLLGGAAGFAILYILIERSPLFSSLRLRANDLEVFCRAIKETAGTLALQEILDASTRIIMEVTGVAGCTLNLFNPRTGRMERRSSIGAGKSAEIEQDSYQKALIAGEPLVVQDTRVREFPEVDDGIESLICVPLRLPDRTLGAVCIYGERGERLSPEMISILGSLGDVVSLAIAHAMVHEDFRTLVDAKTRFMLLASHELRSPSNAIQSIAQTLLQGYLGELTEKQREMISRINVRARILSEVVSDLLVLARGRVEVSTRKYGPVDLGPLAQECILLFEERARQKGVGMDFEPLENGAIVYGNEDGLRSVITNLLENAIKYTPRGGTVTVRLRGDGDRVGFEVQDTGIGIPADDRERLFSEFFRASNAKRLSETGTGLGLAIVKNNVEQCGGSVAVESQEGVGTTVRVSLARR